MDKMVLILMVNFNQVKMDKEVIVVLILLLMEVKVV